MKKIFAKVIATPSSVYNRQIYYVKYPDESVQACTDSDTAQEICDSYNKTVASDYKMGGYSD